MKYRPILFSAPMVRAILEGRKTQTRRVIKYTPALGDPKEWTALPEQRFVGPLHRYCPYGQPGDRLWVRENWAVRRDQDNTRICDLAPTTPWFPVDGQTPSGCGGGMGKTRTAIHMPRWASRITLEITEVRAQRLQEISEEDAVAEGTMAACDWPRHLTHKYCCTAGFEQLWDRINAKRGLGWPANPWVWAISFRRVPQ